MILTPHPILIELAIGPVYTHGLFFAMGALAGALVLAHQRQFFERSLGWMLERSVYIFIFGILAARFAFLLSYPSIWDSVSQIFSFWDGGLVSYGGILGGALVVLAQARAFPIAKRPQWYATVVLACLLGWGIGRFGNFFAGDSVGVASTHWSFFYGRIPIQIFESVLCFSVYFIVRGWLAGNPWRVVYVSGLAYFLGRAVIDTWRDESVVLMLHVSQWISVLVALGIVIIWRYRAEKRVG